MSGISVNHEEIQIITKVVGAYKKNNSIDLMKELLEYDYVHDHKDRFDVVLNAVKLNLGLGSPITSPKPVNNFVQEDCGKPTTWNWFEEEELPEFKWTCSTLGLVPGPISILSAFSNVGKTFFAASLGICVANGLDFLGQIKIERPGKVLHIDWDQSQKFTKIYYWRLLNGYGIKSFNGIEYVKPEWRLNDREEAEKNLLQWLKGHSLCIIDCLGAAVPGEDINEEKIRCHIDFLNEISEKTDCAILLIHHEPKNAGGKDVLRTIKGSGGIISAAGGSIHLTKNESSQEIELQIGKKRMVKDFKISYMLEDCGERIEKIKMQSGLKLVPLDRAETSPETKASSLVSDLLNAIKENPGIGSKELRESVTGYANADIDKTIKDLINANPAMVRTEGNKPRKHYLTQDGESKLAYN